MSTVQIMQRFGVVMIVAITLSTAISYLIVWLTSLGALGALAVGGAVGVTIGLVLPLITAPWWLGK